MTSRGGIGNRNEPATPGSGDPVTDCVGSGVSSGVGLGFRSVDGDPWAVFVGTRVAPPSLFSTGVDGAVPGVMPGITTMGPGPGPGGGGGESVGCGPTP